MNNVKEVLSDIISDTFNVYTNYIYNPAGEPYPRRMLFDHLRRLIDRGTPLVVLYGLRGTGKTFLLYQLLDYYRRQGVDVFYIPVDRVYRRVNDERSAIMGVFDYMGYRPYEIGRKTVILLDEVHVVRNWDGWLKEIYDLSHFNKNLSVVATGSSSISLLSGSEIMRRAVVRELTPLLFSEYLMVKWEGWKPPRGTRRLLNDSLFSGDLKRIYTSIRRAVLRLGSPSTLFEDYMATGGFPIFKKHGEGPTYFDLLEDAVRKIVSDDIPRLADLESETLSTIPDILTFLAETIGSPVSMDKIASRVGLSKSTVRRVLRTLVDAALLIEVKSCGASAALREPKKYYFNHPSLIPAVLGYRSRATIRGLLPQLLENIVASIFSWNSRVTNICYTHSTDFYVEGRDGSALVEVGVGKERTSQFGRSGIKAGRNLLIVQEDAFEEGEKAVRLPAYVLGFL